MGAQQEHPKKLRLLVDVSGSMYRFNGHDGRLEREMETIIMAMEAFDGYEDKIQVRTTVTIPNNCQINRITTTFIVLVPCSSSKNVMAGVAQWVSRLTRNVDGVGSSPIKGPRCFFEQESLPLLLSTGWFQERIRA